MRKNFNLMMLVTVISLFFGSCTVEKRLYSKGYYVQWKHSYNGSSEATPEIAKENKTAENNEITQNKPVIIEEAITSNVDAASETTLTPSVLTVENNTSLETQKTEIKLENSSSKKSNFTGVVIVAKAKSQSNKFVKPLVRKATKSDSNSAGGPDKTLLMILCFFIPWLAVGLATDWDLKPLIFNLLWSLTCIGGVIHALVVVSREA